MTVERPQRILGYLRACVEAEDAARHHLVLDGQLAGCERPLLLERGSAPLGDSDAVLAPSNRARRWADARGDAAGEESLWVGWPIVRGHRRVAGRRAEVVAGLIVGRLGFVAASDDDDQPALVPLSRSVELGDEALDLLGYPSDERELLRRDFDRALNRGRGDAFAAAVGFLQARGLTPASFDPRSLVPLDQAQPLSNTAVAWVADAGAAPAPNVARDLEELARQPTADTAVGPLAVCLADQPLDPGHPSWAHPAAEPVPAVAPTDIDQEDAIAAALHRPLSAVTAPGGLGRSDLLVNTVAAALARHERVLIVSGNERALDVVTERLQQSSPRANAVRVGLGPTRSGAAEAIDQALAAATDRPGTPLDQPARRAWDATRADIDEPYRRLAERRDLSRRMAAVSARRARVEASLPDGGPAQGDAERLARALDPARNRLDEWRALPRRRPWQMPRARAAEKALAGVLGAAIDALQGPVQEAARRQLDARHYEAALAMVETAAEVLEATDELASLSGRIATLPDEERLLATIQMHYPRRDDVAAALYDERWADRGEVGARARSVVQLYQSGLSSLGDTTSLLALHKLVPDVLGLVPVWVVSTAAVGLWFPLTAGLFDLVIVDDAGQADIASALPALFRGRRAMVVGDAHQLGPASSLTTDLDAQLASTHELSEDDHRRFSQRRWSLLTFAARACGDDPVFLGRTHGVDPDLVRLVGQQWYEGRLQADDPIPWPGPAVRWVDHRGHFEPGRGGRSGRNASEALVVVDEVLGQLAELRARQLQGAGVTGVTGVAGVAGEPAAFDAPALVGAAPPGDLETIGPRLPRGFATRSGDGEAPHVPEPASGGDAADPSHDATDGSPVGAVAGLPPPPPAPPPPPPPDDHTGPAADEVPAAAGPDPLPDPVPDPVPTELASTGSTATARLATMLTAPLSTPGAGRPARVRPGDPGLSTLDLRDQPVRSIGVVTPLAAQRDALRDLLLERFGRSITVDTPDGFQGDERDVIIISLVIGPETRRELVDLVADECRLNVALTSARSRVIIVGDRAAAAAASPLLADLAEWADHLANLTGAAAGAAT